MKYAIPLIVAGKIGGCVALMEYNSADVNEPYTKMLTERQSVITDPQDDKKYVVDFGNKTMIEYEQIAPRTILNDDALEDIIKRR